MRRYRLVRRNFMDRPSLLPKRQLSAYGAVLPLDVPDLRLCGDHCPALARLWKMQHLRPRTRLYGAHFLRGIFLRHDLKTLPHLPVGLLLKSLQYRRRHPPRLRTALVRSRAALRIFIPTAKQAGLQIRTCLKIFICLIFHYIFLHTIYICKFPCADL